MCVRTRVANQMLTRGRYFILDTSVGGDWAGDPVASEMPVEHAIDAVRVFGPADAPLKSDDAASSDALAPRLKPTDEIIPSPPVPTIAGGPAAWRPFIGMPDLSLGPFGGNIANSTEHGKFSMQPVDFAVWQAADGSWQLQSCIRNTGIGAASGHDDWTHSRLFYRWESQPANGTTFPTSGWKEVGVVMIGEERYGERQGGLMAPHVTRWGDVFHMFYGSWV